MTDASRCSVSDAAIRGAALRALAALLAASPHGRLPAELLPRCLQASYQNDLM